MQSMDSKLSPYNRAYAGSFREQESNNNYVSRISCKRCTCCVITVLLAILIIISVIAILFVFVLKPKKPEFSLQYAQMESLSIEPPTLSDMAIYLTMNITMIFTAMNPNKVGLKYNPSNFCVMYSGLPMGFATIPAFYQPSHSNTTLQAQFVVKRLNIQQNPTLKLMRDITVNHRLEMRITGDVETGLSFVGINSPKLKILVDCEIKVRPRGDFMRDKTRGADEVDIFSSPVTFKQICSILVYV